MDKTFLLKENKPYIQHISKEPSSKHLTLLYGYTLELHDPLSSHIRKYPFELALRLSQLQKNPV